MEQSAFDVFFSVKNYLYLGEYNKCLEEISIMDINEDDMSQRVKKNFYTFIFRKSKGRRNQQIISRIENPQRKTDQNIFQSLFIFRNICIQR